MKFALVGCGNIAKKHAHVIENYLDDSEIITCCDTVLERSEKFGKKIGVPYFDSIGLVV